MNLEEARVSYREKRRGTNAGSGAELAYNKVLICLDNARDEVEARQYLQAEVENCTDPSRKKVYQQALASLQN